MRMVPSLVAVVALIATPCLQAQEPKPPVPVQPVQTQSPPAIPHPPTVGSARAATKDGKVYLEVTEAHLIPMEEQHTYTVYLKVPFEEDDGNGGKRKVYKEVPETKVGTRTVFKTVFVTKQFAVANNPITTVTDASGKTLTEADLLRLLEKPAPVFTFNEKADLFYLKSLNLKPWCWFTSEFPQCRRLH